jgi:hypothetical protein
MDTAAHQATADRAANGSDVQPAAAIAAEHRSHGLTSPASDPAVTTLLRHARRIATRRRAPPPTAVRLIRMATACPGDLAGLRDRALLLLTAAGLGRSALVGLDVEQVHFMEDGVDLVLNSQLGAPSPSVASRPSALARCALKDRSDQTPHRSSGGPAVAARFQHGRGVIPQPQPERDVELLHHTHRDIVAVGRVGWCVSVRHLAVHRIHTQRATLHDHATLDCLGGRLECSQGDAPRLLPSRFSRG